MGKTYRPERQHQRGVPAMPRREPISRGWGAGLGPAKAMRLLAQLVFNPYENSMKLISRPFLAFTLVLAGIAGCVCAEPKTHGDAAQIIVKFKDANTEPASASLLKSLGQTTKLKVRHVRPMSGGAQIYVLSGSGDEAQLTQVIKRISARPDVEYAELDRKLKPQKE